jgi:hypothetical protein
MFTLCHCHPISHRMVNWSCRIQRWRPHSYTSCACNHRSAVENYRREKDTLRIIRFSIKAAAVKEYHKYVTK